MQINLSCRLAGFIMFEQLGLVTCSKGITVFPVPQQLKSRGIARIFQRGGHTVSNIIVMAFSPRNIVQCRLFG